MMNNQTNSTLISLRDIEKYYQVGEQNLQVLKKVNLEVAHGDYLSIMGSSGSGKSTLMNILGFLDRPSAGDYLLKGENVSQLNDDQESKIRNKEIGFVYQNFNLLGRNTAFENVSMPLFYGEGKIDETKVKEALSIVGLADRMHHKPNELSGGQRQRVAIARALVNQPSLILADEPTGALDSKTSEEIMQLFESLHQNGCTIIIVTHEEEVAECTKRKIVMKDGVVYEES